MWYLNALSDEGELVDRARETSSLRSDLRLRIQVEEWGCVGFACSSKRFSPLVNTGSTKGPLLWVVGRFADWFV